jgi:L-aminopeptidase/D-esterase-like protein
MLDVLERIADIVTAGMARSGTIYDDNLDPDILVLAYKNTIELLKSNIKIVEG